MGKVVVMMIVTDGGGSDDKSGRWWRLSLASHVMNELPLLPSPAPINFGKVFQNPLSCPELLKPPCFSGSSTLISHWTCACGACSDLLQSERTPHLQIVVVLMMIVTDGGGCDDDSDR